MNYTRPLKVPKGSHIDFTIQDLDRDLAKTTANGKWRYSPCYFYMWTLLHPIPFVPIKVSEFSTVDELKRYAVDEANRTFRDRKLIPSHPIGVLFNYAFKQIEKEWQWWLDFLNSRGLEVDEKSTDNLLMEQIREMIIKRDEYKCYLCGTPVTSKRAEVHHIMSKGRLSKRLRGKSVPTNLITLCKICHNALHIDLRS